MVHFGGTVSEEQFQAAMRMLAGKQSNALSTLVAAIVSLALVVWAPGWIKAIVVVFMLAMAASWWLQSPIRLRRLFANREELRHFVHGSFDEAEFQYGVNRVAWSSVRKVQSDDAVALVYAPHVFIVPSSFFATPEEFSAFVDTARAHVTPPAQSSLMGRSLKSALLWVVIIIVVFVLWSLGRR
jgi:hypothetical protein